MEKSLEGLTAISENQGIYQTTVHNTYLKDVRDSADRQHIIRIRFFVKPYNDKFEVTVFVPTKNIFDYYSIVFSTARKYKRSVTVKYILPYTEDIWNFI